MLKDLEGRDSMRFKIYRMHFTGAVHFGEGGLITSADTLMADTVFGALCSEAVMQSNGTLEKLVEYANGGRLLISDGLPFIEEALYVPKPVMEVQGREEGDSKIKKALKKLRFIPLDKMEIYLHGDMDIASEALKFQDGFAASDMIEKATVPEEDVTRPYAVAVKRYKEGSGLYLCAGYDSDEVKELFEMFLDQLSYSGIGGERSSGYGRFEWTSREDEGLSSKLSAQDAEWYMSLSVCLPDDPELDKVVEGASYMTVRRGGWVSSVTYADTLRKKKDIYMMAAGSVFNRRFDGGIYDISDGGRHPVYRYGKPMLMAII